MYNFLLFCFVLGTPALTSRGFIEEDFAKVAYFFDLAVKLALKIKGEAKGIYLHIILRTHTHYMYKHHHNCILV